MLFSKLPEIDVVAVPTRDIAPPSLAAVLPIKLPLIVPIEPEPEYIAPPARFEILPIKSASILFIIAFA